MARDDDETALAVGTAGEAPYGSTDRAQGADPEPAQPGPSLAPPERRPAPAGSGASADAVADPCLAPALRAAAAARAEAARIRSMSFAAAPPRRPAAAPAPLQVPPVEPAAPPIRYRGLTAAEAAAAAFIRFRPLRRAAGPLPYPTGYGEPEPVAAQRHRRKMELVSPAPASPGRLRPEDRFLRFRSEITRLQEPPDAPGAGSRELVPIRVTQVGANRGPRWWSRLFLRARAS